MIFKTSFTLILIFPSLKYEEFCLFCFFLMAPFSIFPNFEMFTLEQAQRCDQFFQNLSARFSFKDSNLHEVFNIPTKN